MASSYLKIGSRGKVKKRKIKSGTGDGEQS